ncbi:hypothetical protein XylorDRAFT_0087 [Xylanibacter oryzae DSM 17970]|uniref:Uncharacterized protein n=1 Tax=Xylanibacter oryzae DSM 17970 TaxID=915438 RepID=A0ABN0RU30_9BACT|nr:hypothetical protein [Xylanibacter oryzae]EXG77742.1 hypothetical protein XylorDRAFT_0087 [Xylanibacter oryzae DSM 17970]
MKYIFKLFCLSMATTVLVACNKDEDHYYIKQISKMSVYISLQDSRGNLVNDSATISKLVGFKNKINDMRGATQERPFDYEDILHINGTWYYTIVPSERYNVQFPSSAMYIATDTLTFGKTKYELQQMVDFNVSTPDSDKVVWLKIDKQKVNSMFPDEFGFYFRLTYK